MSQYYQKMTGFVPCACMGEIYGEPYCPCTMARKGLPKSDAHVAAEKKSAEEWNRLVSCGFFNKKEEK